jgi:hypothetical protein
MNAVEAVEATKRRELERRRGRLPEERLKYHAGVGLGGQRMKMKEEDEERVV